MNDSPNRRNRVTFGLGTVGRDMFYAFEANILLYFLTNVLSLPLILSGIKVDNARAESINDVGNLLVKVVMFAISLVSMVAGYIIYLKKYKISEEYYANSLKDLEQREK